VGGFRLKRFDESAASSRKGSQASTPPRSVVGIGNKGTDLVFVALTARFIIIDGLHPQLRDQIIRRQKLFLRWYVTRVSRRMGVSNRVKVGLPARGKSYLSNKLMIYLKVRLPPKYFYS